MTALSAVKRNIIVVKYASDAFSPQRLAFWLGCFKLEELLKLLSVTMRYIPQQERSYIVKVVSYVGDASHEKIVNLGARWMISVISCNFRQVGYSIC